MKVLLGSFHLNGHTLRFHLQTKKYSCLMTCPPSNPLFSVVTRSDKHSALMGDIEVEKESDNESSDSERSSKFDFGPPLLFSGDSIDVDSLPENIKSRMETITIRRQMVGKLGKFNAI